MYSGHLRSIDHKNNIRAVSNDEDPGVELLRTAFKCRLASYRLCSNNHHIVLAEFMGELKNKILTVITRDLSKFTSIKLNFEVFGYYYLESRDRHDIKSFNSKNVIITISGDLNEIYDDFTAIPSKPVMSNRHRITSQTDCTADISFVTF